MSHARQRKLAEDLGMEIPQMINFIKTGDEQISRSVLDAASQQKEGVDSVTNAVERFGDKFTRALQKPEDQIEMLRRKVDIDLTETSIKFANTMAAGYQEAFNTIQIPEEAKDIVGEIYSKTADTADFIFDEIIIPTIEHGNDLLEVGAKLFKDIADGVVVIEERNQAELKPFVIEHDLGEKATAEIKAEVNKSTAVSAQNTANMSSLVTQQQTMNTTVADLTGLIANAETEVNMSVDGNVFGSYTHRWIEEKYGVILTAEMQ